MVDVTISAQLVLCTVDIIAERGSYIIVRDGLCFGTHTMPQIAPPSPLLSPQTEISRSRIELTKALFEALRMRSMGVKSINAYLECNAQERETMALIVCDLRKSGDIVAAEQKGRFNVYTLPGAR
jgi:hypothetical protein